MKNGTRMTRKNLGTKRKFSNDLRQFEKKVENFRKRDQKARENMIPIRERLSKKREELELTSYMLGGSPVPETPQEQNEKEQTAPIEQIDKEEDSIMKNTETNPPPAGADLMKEQANDIGSNSN